MKIHYLFIIIALVLGCKEGTNQNNLPTKESNAEQINKSDETNSDQLKQNGDYSELFGNPDCKVTSAEEISTLLGTTFIDINVASICAYKSEISKNKTWTLGIMRNDMKRKDIQREIDSFKKDETGILSIQLSETGDTYLCNQHSHGYLSIYNPNYDGSFLITYGSVATSRGFSKEERIEHQRLAMLLANFLLKKYQN
jgi:hypothetical protein